MSSSVRANVSGDFLHGGGEMGALVRAYDWSATPLGARGTWPQSLSTAVSICLASRFPMLIMWGPEKIQIYNDGYRPVLGAKHPKSLGQRGEECWWEIWPVVGPMFESVRVTGESTWSEDLLLVMERYGYVEETYFTFSYSAIRDETGGVGGLLVTCVETTERVLGERRLRTLRELGEHPESASTLDTCAAAATTLAQNPADLPFALLYLLDRDGTTARLAGTAALEPGAPAAPEIVDLALDDERGWPLARAAAAGEPQIVLDVVRRFGALPAGPWQLPPHTAVVLPVARAGETRPAALLVAGITPARALDDEYRGFLDLVAAHIANAIASAEASEETRRRAEALAELDRAKTAFFSNVSHELRTPLTLLLGPLQQLLGDAHSAEQRESAAIAHRNALRLQRLVDTLLDFTRIEAGRAQATYEAVDIAALTTDLASTFRAAIETAGLQLVVDAQSPDEPVYVDREMWEKIVLNLLSNAFKHTFTGTIEVRVRPAAHAVELVVSDTGVGIAADDLPKIFDRFQRAKGARARSHEGTGIGLALVHELVHLHAGRVDVVSEVDRGTQFTIAIPTGTSHLPADRVQPEPLQASGTGGRAALYVEEALRWLPDDALAATAEDAGVPHDAARVLVADDNADMRLYLRRLLGTRWRVDTAPDGAAALAQALAKPPDLVLADVMMPQLDGFELLHALREHERTRALPVILLSARAGEESRVEGMAAGADDYIVKPFSARELVARVSGHLELARLRRLAELERERVTQQIEQERERLLALFEQAPAFMAVMRGPDHIFERANALYFQLVHPRDVIGKPALVVLPELEEQGYIQLLDHVYHTGETYVGTEALVQLRTADDEPLRDMYLNFIYQPLRGHDGAVTGVFAHGVDVTELVAARKTAEAANEAKGQFMAMVSHELRTPLNGIIGYLELLRLGVPEPLPAPLLRHVDRIGWSTRHLQQIIDELLTFTRLEAGREETAPEEIDIEQLLEEVHAVIEPLIDEKSLHFRVDTARAPAIVRTDPRKVRQILLNLLGNAVKFTDKGVVTLHIRADHDEVLFAVSDTGIGLTPEQMEQVFTAFWQADQSRTRTWGGTGLGLSISQRLARLIGGEIRVSSEYGKGSTFTLAVPQHAPQHTPA